MPLSHGLALFTYVCGICCRCHQSWSYDLQAASHPVWQKLKAAQAEYRHTMAGLKQQGAPSMLFLSGVSKLLRHVAEVCPHIALHAQFGHAVSGLVTRKCCKCV